MDIILGFIFSSLIAVLAYRKKSLSRSGLFAAIIIGTLLYFFGGHAIWLTLMMFFISSSLITKIKEQEKDKEEINAKSGNRDYAQVLANGLLPLVGAILFYFTDNYRFILISAISIAVCNADTWASELGVLSKGKTISIITFKEVKRGTSGGISLLGTFVSFLGGLFIALFYVSYSTVVLKLPFSFINIALIACGGLAGSLIDSILGATIQAKYRCIVCNKQTEKTYHHSNKTELIGGWKFINNDMVNFLSSLIVILIFYMF